MRQIVCISFFLLLVFSMSAYGSGSQVTFGGEVIVEAGNTIAGDVVVFGGNIEIKGEVLGDVVAIGGRVLVEGRIAGDLTAVGARAELLEGATIHGDTRIISGSVSRERGVSIGGSYSHITPIPGSIQFFPSIFHRRSYSFSPSFPSYPSALSILFSFLFQLLLLLLITYLFPSNVEVIRSTLHKSMGHSILIGFLGLLILVPFMIFLTITIIGIPLALLTPVFYWVAIAIGRAGIYLALGEWLRRHIAIRADSIIVTSVLGLILYFLIRLLLRFIPYLGGVIWAIILFLIYIAAFGSTIKSRFGTGAPWFHRAS